MSRVRRRVLPGKVTLGLAAPPRCSASAASCVRSMQVKLVAKHRELRANWPARDARRVCYPA